MTLPLIPQFIHTHYEKGHNEGSLNAFVLIVDIKGYTSYTRKVMAEGSTGAEKVSLLLNSIFSPQVKLVYQTKGFIPYFAGDAYSVIFPSDDTSNIEEINELALRLRANIKNNPDIPKDELGIKISIGYGKVEWVIGGGDSKYYCFHGDVFQQVGILNSTLESYEIAYGIELKDQVSRISNLDGLPKPFSNDLVINKDKSFDWNDDILQQFIPQLEQLKETSSEFREAVSVFVKFDFKDGIFNQQAITGCFEWCRKYDLYFKEIESGDKGLLLFGFLGAPTTHINLKKRALSWAIHCSESLKNHKNVDFRISMNLGRVFCGFIGGKERIQYGIVGHSVNCASRYLGIADPNTIIVDRSMLIAGLKSSFKVSTVLKGLESATDLFVIKGFRQRMDQQIPLFGREKEIEVIENHINDFLSNEAKENLLLIGDAGVGKSRLLKKIKRNSEKKENLLYVSLYCNEIDYSAFLPFVVYLKNMLDYRKGMRFPAFSRRLYPLIGDLNQLEQKRLVEVFAVLLGIKIERGFFHALDAQSQFQIIKDSFIKFFKAFTKDQKLVIKIDDIQWIDYSTSTLLKEINEVLNPLLIFSSRPIESGQKEINNYLFEDLKYKKLQLKALRKNGVKSIIEFHLKGKVDDTNCEFLLEASDGNPFFLDQIMQYLKGINAWVEKDDLWMLKSLDIDLNSGMQSILLSRIDRLDPKIKEAVKYAAVLGKEFDEDVFSNVIFPSENITLTQGDKFYRLISEGLSHNIWRRLGNNRFVFNHALLREAVYDMQSIGDLQKKHIRAATAIETLHKEDLKSKYFALLHHFEKGGDEVNLKKYLLLAASFARINFRSFDALKFYEKYLNQNLDNREKLRAKINIYEIYELLGEWVKAKEIIDESLDLATDLHPLYLAIVKRQEGKHLTLRGDYTEAGESLDIAYEIFKNNDDPKGTIACLEAMGSLYFRQSKYPEASSFFEEAVVLKKDFKNDIPNFSSIGKLGLTYMNLGQLQKGIDILEEYLKSPVINKLQECILSIYLGIIKQEFGNFNGAEYNFHNGLHIAQLTQNKLFLSIAYGGLGAIHMFKGNYKVAWEYLEKDLVISNELGDKQGKSIVYGLFGEYSLLNGSKSNALAYFKKQETLARELGYVKGYLKSMYGQLEARLGLKQYQELIDSFNEIPTKHIGTNNMSFDIFIPMFKCYHILDKKEECENTLSKMKAIDKELHTIFTHFIVTWFSLVIEYPKDYQSKINEFILNTSEVNTAVYQKINKRLSDAMLTKV